MWLPSRPSVPVVDNWPPKPLLDLDYGPVHTCWLCDRREADCTVVIEDVVTPVCDTCFQRADDG